MEISFKTNEKILYNNLKKILRKSNIGINSDEIDKMPWCSVYHFHDWDHGYDAFYGYNGKRREFYKDLTDTLKFLNNYFLNNNISYIIVAPFFKYYQFEYIPKNDDVNFDIYDEIKIWLKKNKIRSGELSGVLIDVKENINELAMLMEGAFRGVSCLNFLLPQSNVLIVPDHHFSLTFYTKQIEGEKKCIKSILEKHTFLRYFEEN